MFKELVRPEPVKGIKFWQNEKNKFNVLMLHYSADQEKDPERNGEEWIENEMEGMPKSKWNKEYEIDFTTKSGKLIYGSEFCDFDPKIHFINSFEVPDAEYILSLDFGQRNPTAALVGAWTRDKRLYIIDEYYKPALPSVASREMFDQFKYLIGDVDGKSFREKRIMADNAFQIKVIDPTTQSKNRAKTIDGEEIPYSVIEEFYDHGFDFEPGINNVEPGIIRVREFFTIDQNKKSRIYIFKDKCPNLCWELEHYRYKELNEAADRTHNQSEEPVKKDDHACDALRMLCMARPYEKPEEAIIKTLIQRDIESLLRPKVLGNSLNDYDDFETQNADHDI